jgi:predicted component of type VI protein secretion system
MAILKQVLTGREVPLAHHTLVGRSPDADLQIDDRRISSEHAVIVWNEGAWELKDLASRNGTVVNGHRVEPGTRIPLREELSVRFGSPNEHWVVTSLEPPDVVAVAIGSGEVVQGEHGLLSLNPGTTLLTEDGLSYFLEVDGQRQPVADRHMVELGDRRFRLAIPPPRSEDSRTLTVESALVHSDVSFQFTVSPDEEHVQVTLKGPGVEKSLRSRSFDYMLLALARARKKDEEENLVEPAEQGWVYADELAQALGVDISHVNVDIYRARRRFADAGVHGADDLIERRASPRAVRLGGRSIEIF